METIALTPSPTQWGQNLAIACAGPALIGLAAGWALGGASPLLMAALVPAAFLVVAAVSLPGLYVGSALLGAAPELSVIARVVAEAGRSQGMIFLGLTPALLFLSATATDIHEAIILGIAGVFLGAVVGLYSFHKRLCEESRRGTFHVVFAIWAALSMFLGAEVYMKLLHVGGALP